MSPITPPSLLELTDKGWSFAQSIDDLTNDNPSWFTVDYKDKNTVDNIFRLLDVSQAQETSLRDPNIRPRLWLNANKQQILLFIRGINLNPNAEPEDMVGLRIFFDGKRLVCFRSRKLQALALIREELAKEPKKYPDLQHLFVIILKQLLLRIEHHITKLANQLDDYEDCIDEGKDVGIEKIEEMRRSSAKLWRYLQPQQDVLKRLTQVDFTWVQEELRMELHEIEDSMTYNIEELALVRERCQLVESHFASQLSQKVNTNLYLISIITAIFIPVSFLTGLLGINVGGMPGVDNSKAFWIVCSALLVIAVVEFIYLKRKRWF